MEAHYQPIVDLSANAVVGYEALARDADGRFPVAAFAAARAEGRLQELDRECLRAAFRGAAGLGRQTALFVNVEPACFDGPDDLEAPDVPVIVELTERELAVRPSELLLAVERVRARGWGVAVDDIGADWRSLALMPFLEPDVVKLDRGVLSGPTTAETARVVRGAKAQVARHGGLLLAEGIEEVEHAQRAIGFGATLGQGWRFGRPAPLPPAPDAGGPPLPVVRRRRPIDDRTPFQALKASGLPVGVGTKAELLPLSIDLEREAAETRDPAVVLATFQDAERFGANVAERYAGLASGAAFVGAFGVGMAPEPAPGVRGASLAAAEALRDEWCVLVVGPHATMALIARDLGDTGDDDRRRFEYALTEDRDLIMRAARSLMLRVVAEPAPRPAIRANLTAV